ncbi:hypothetical protein ARMSODRAFT_1006830 [Armillaria solidipes]|uniref:Uncharacterized protein n=1 Tax=Armillaria solidipes TaxID=1076256 RepID=A0A2H3B209_9AGAR|nr:hypothetical protein ARMSODRAFT_1006830 [Armillaria solidipes]
MSRNDSVGVLSTRVVPSRRSTARGHDKPTAPKLPGTWYCERGATRNNETSSCADTSLEYHHRSRKRRQQGPREKGQVRLNSSRLSMNQGIACGDIWLELEMRYEHIKARWMAQQSRKKKVKVSEILPVFTGRYTTFLSTPVLERRIDMHPLIHRYKLQPTTKILMSTTTLRANVLRPPEPLQVLQVASPESSSLLRGLLNDG